MNSKKIIFLADKISAQHVELIKKLPVETINLPGLSAKEFEEKNKSVKPNIIGKYLIVSCQIQESSSCNF